MNCSPSRNPAPHTAVIKTMTSFARATLITGSILLGSLGATAQEARLVKDFNKTGFGSATRYLIQANEKIYFSADDGIHGGELWITDGTANGTRLVRDIYPGETTSFPHSFAAVGDEVFFMAQDGVSGLGLTGRGLWRSDGTEEGTTMVMASYGEKVAMDDFLFFGATSSPFRGLWRIGGLDEEPVLLKTFVEISRMERHRENVFFWDAGTNPPELWKSDGTPEGTVQVAAVPFGNYWNIFSAGDFVYFKVYNPQTRDREELWKTDGTGDGTVKFMEFSLGGETPGPSTYAVLNGTLYFILHDVDRTELWKSDGTEAGTIMVRNFNSGGWLSMRPLATVENDLYLVLNGRELWRSDGTDEGTALVKEFASWRALYPGEIHPAVFEGILYFSARDDENGAELWKTDGTEAGTIRVKDIREGEASSEPTYPAVLGGELYFSADDGIHGRELWVTDGTGAGTRVFRDINPGTAGSKPTFHPINGRMVVTVNHEGSNYSAWRTDGTPEETFPLPIPGQPGGMFQFGDDLFFRVRSENGTELWKTNGTDEGTELVKQIHPTSSGVLLLYRKELNGILFFTADDGVHGVELWSTDGTEAGTKMVLDLSPGNTSSNPQNFAVVRDRLIFLAYQNGWGWWQTDGTGAGTVPVESDHTGGWSFVRHVTPLGDKLVFVADGSDGNGSELWVLDESGVRLLKDIHPGGSSSPLHFLRVGESVFFIALDGVHGQELWKTDGTTAGTVLVRDIRAGSSHSYVTPWADLRGELIFTANDGIHGAELWKSDGTKAGTNLLYEFTPGSDGSTFGGHLLLDDVLYFGMNAELWTTDGTATGTRRIADGWSSTPNGFALIDGAVFFVAGTSESGSELWITDGTREGTFQATNIAPGAASAPNQLHKIGTDLYFSAYRPDVGQELFILPLGAKPSLPNPPRNRFAASDQPLLISPDAEGDNLRYSWYRDGTLIEDADGPTLVIESPSGDNSGTYRVVARNLAGIVEATFRVTVDPVRPVVNSTEFTGNGFRIRFSSMEGMPYRIEASENLTDWVTLLESALPLGGNEGNFLDPAPEGSSRFYRILLLP